MPLSDAALSRTKALTTQDVADLLKISKQKVNEMVAAGELPSMKIGRAVRFDPQVFADWLKETATSREFKPLEAPGERTAPERKGFKSLFPDRQ